VQPYTEHLMKGGVTIDYHPQPDGEHNTKWWPEMKEPFEKFVASHPREPHPDHLSWETGDAAHNRSHWLVIDQLGATPDDAKDLPDVNIRQVGGRSEKLFGATTIAGRVDLVRNGNVVQASTRRVASFTLLLSPTKFDFDQPIKVVVNGREVFNARVQRSVKTLMTWAARDNDRTMLYGAELTVRLPR